MLGLGRVSAMRTKTPRARSPNWARANRPDTSRTTRSTTPTTKALCLPRMGSSTCIEAVIPHPTNRHQEQIPAVDHRRRLAPSRSYAPEIQGVSLPRTAAFLALCWSSPAFGRNRLPVPTRGAGLIFVTGRSPASVLAAASEKAATGELTAVVSTSRRGLFRMLWLLSHCE
jgi:hypothetical protein